MVEKILNNTTPYGKIRASHEGSLHSSTLNYTCRCCKIDRQTEADRYIYQTQIIEYTKIHNCKQKLSVDPH